MPKEVLKLIENIIFYLVLVYLVVASFYMAGKVTDLKLENEQLQQEVTDLEIRNLELELQRDALIDGAWHEHNNQMLEGEKD